MLMSYDHQVSVAKIVGKPLGRYSLENRWSSGTQIELGDFSLQELNDWLNAVRWELGHLRFRPAGMS